MKKKRRRRLSLSLFSSIRSLRRREVNVFPFFGDGGCLPRLRPGSARVRRARWFDADANETLLARLASTNVLSRSVMCGLRKADGPASGACVLSRFQYAVHYILHKQYHTKNNLK